MNWYRRIASGVRYFRVTTNAGTRVLRAMDPDHIYALYDNIVDLEEISRDEAASWDASGGAIQHVFSSVDMNGKQHVFAKGDHIYVREAARSVLGQAGLLGTIENLRGTLATAAQKIYDAWDQDADGYDEVVGMGGICQDIAEEFCSVMGGMGLDCTTFDAQVGDQHVWAVVYDPQSEEAYSVDIPPSVYETGTGYVWQKIPNVSFGPEDIIVEPMNYGDLRAAEGVY